MLLGTNFPSPSEKDNRDGIKLITRYLRLFLNEKDPEKRSQFLSHFVHQIYHNAVQVFHKDPELRTVFTLESIMPKDANKNNLKKACTIIREAGWGTEGIPWDNQNIFTTTFQQLMDIPVFIPAIYYGPVSSIVLLFLLYKKELHFFSGITREQTIKEIIALDSHEKNTLHDIYLGRSEKNQAGSYEVKIKAIFNISFDDLPPLDFNEITKDKNSNEILSLLEAYDFYRHFCLNHSRLRSKGATLFQDINWDTASLVSQDYDEASCSYNEQNSLLHIARKWIAFKTILLILAYQNDESHSIRFNTEIFNFQILRGLIRMIPNMCYNLARMVSTVCMFYEPHYGREITDDVLSYFNNYLQFFQKRILSPLVSENVANNEVKKPSTVQKGQLFHNILWILEMHDLQRHITYVQSAWRQFDNNATSGIRVSSDAFIRNTLPLFKAANADGNPLKLPMAVDNWRAFYAKYHDELSSIFQGATERQLRTIWKKSIITFAFCQGRDHDKITFKTNIRDVVNSDITTGSLADAIQTWWSDNISAIRTIPLPWVLEMMIVYIFSDQIPVIEKGRDTRYFSNLSNDNNANSNHPKGRAPKKLRYYIDNIASHYNDELNAIIIRQISVITTKLMLPPPIKDEWMKFIEKLDRSILDLTNALRCHIDDKNINPYTRREKEIVTAFAKIWVELAIFNAKFENTAFLPPQLLQIK